jgi:hypothetical protein
MLQPPAALVSSEVGELGRFGPSIVTGRSLEFGRHGRAAMLVGARYAEVPDAVGRGVHRQRGLQLSWRAPDGPVLGLLQVALIDIASEASALGADTGLGRMFTALLDPTTLGMRPAALREWRLHSVPEVWVPVLDLTVTAACDTDRMRHQLLWQAVNYLHELVPEVVGGAAGLTVDETALVNSPAARRSAGHPERGRARRLLESVGMARAGQVNLNGYQKGAAPRFCPQHPVVYVVPQAFAGIETCPRRAH